MLRIQYLEKTPNIMLDKRIMWANSKK